MEQFKIVAEKLKGSLEWNYGGVGAGISGILSAAGTIFTGLVGGWDVTIRLLLVIMIVDYLSGLAAAWKNKALDSKVAFWGGINKLFVFCLVAVGYQVDIALGFTDPFVRTAIIWFYIGREGLSILENYGKMGQKVPEFLREILVQVQDKGDGGKDGLIVPMGHNSRERNGQEHD